MEHTEHRCVHCNSPVGDLDPTGQFCDFCYDHELAAQRNWNNGTTQRIWFYLFMLMLTFYGFIAVIVGVITSGLGPQ